ncbi:MAG: hypothetical protein EA365_09070 [Gloeocapsa sp. DLM2.Bin57]|nr:MAG: hypothetical protein EA365_09070 [Gloeocapsa sp. DLM2.Bin57]
MSRRYWREFLRYLVIISIPLSTIIYLLRGIGILSGMSGGVILLLFLLASVSTITYGLEKTR